MTTRTESGVVFFYDLSRCFQQCVRMKTSSSTPWMFSYPIRSCEFGFSFVILHLNADDCFFDSGFLVHFRLFHHQTFLNFFLGEYLLIDVPNVILKNDGQRLGSSCKGS